MSFPISEPTKSYADLIGLVFGIKDLPWWPVDVKNAVEDTYREMNKEGLKKLELKVKTQKKLLQVLRRDPDLKEYLDKRLRVDLAVLEVQMENVESWAKWIHAHVH